MSDSIQNDDGSIRLQVFLSKSGVASRRASAEIIEQGRVQVNKKVIREPGYRIQPGDSVRVDGTSVHMDEEFVYLIMNKPEKVICSADDPEGRVSALDIVAGSYPQRLFSVGRLDYMTCGLLLLTNDGNFANALSHPSSGIVKKYRVESKTQIPRDMLENWKNGVRIRGEMYRLKDFFYESAHSVILSLTEGKNREIRNVFANSKITIRSLERTHYGSITLGNLKSGKFRELSHSEVSDLLAAASSPRTKAPRSGKKPAQRAGGTGKKAGTHGSPQKRSSGKFSGKSSGSKSGKPANGRSKPGSGAARGRRV